MDAAAMIDWKARRAEAERRDAADPLAHLRSRFALPEGVIYFDGNSLGALPRAAVNRIAAAAEEEWGRSLIRGWSRGWMELPARVGAKIAPLVGARAHEVLAADSTSVNLFKLAAAALAAQPERSVILTQQDNFPTDLYVLEGLRDFLGRSVEVRRVPAARLRDSIDAGVALVTLTHVHYKTAEIWDMEGVTAKAHAAGALVLWDLSHSAGALPVDLNGAGADLAVGCGYKFLNGGPGAPAFLFVAERHHGRLKSPLAGWMGHADPMAFAADYRPAPGIGRFACGTPPVLGLSALEAALDVFAETDMAALYAKTQKLGQLFIELTENLPDVAVLSPRQAERRGSQVALAHPDSQAIMARLIERGVIGDFRPPDVLRFGFAPLYQRYVDVVDAAHALAQEVRASPTALQD